ncbi:MAG: DNA polymerase III subunit gamma/tau, partial [Wolinella sp.]
LPPPKTHDEEPTPPPLPSLEDSPPEESLEPEGSRCVASMLEESSAPCEASKEKLTEAILESPLVSAAKELLEVKKIIVRSKV